MRHSLICVRPDGTIEGVVSLTDIFSFLLNSSAPAAESRIAALKQDYAAFEAQEASRMNAEAAAAASTSDGSTTGSAGGPNPSPRIIAEERLRQRAFLSDHGQAPAEDGEGMEDDGFLGGEEAREVGNADLPGVFGADGMDGTPHGHVDPQALQSAIAAGTASALTGRSRAAAHSLRVNGGLGASGPPFDFHSPGIQPSVPNDGVPKSVDFLG
jgi:hypothetical protein